MVNNLFPKAGTVLSVEWKPYGPQIMVHGSAKDLAVSLAILAGQLEVRCDFSHEEIKAAAAGGKALVEALSRGGITVDLAALAQQRKEAEGECGSES